MHGVCQEHLQYILMQYICSAHFLISGFCSDVEKSLFMEEINVMKKVSDGSNPHVLKMIGCITTTLPVMLVMQFVPQGNLRSYLKAKKTKAAAKVRDDEMFHDFISLLYSNYCNPVVYVPRVNDKSEP